MMVGLSVVLEGKSSITKVTQVLNKATNVSIMAANKPPPPPFSPPSSRPIHSYSPRTSANHFPLPAFLDQCFLCGQKLLPGTDIYMYKGDRAFCSEECRCKQIFMDEDDQEAAAATPNNIKKKPNNCSLMAATRPTTTSSTSASSSRASSSGSSRHKRVLSRNRLGGFAY